LQQHNYDVDHFIILCDEAVGGVGASGSDFARNSAARIIPLLFGCYSAVNSAVIPLLGPLLIVRSRVRNSSKCLNQRTFSRRFFVRDGRIGFFSPITEEFRLPADPESV